MENPSDIRSKAKERDHYELLSTKLTPPGLHPPYVPRPNLVARIDEGLERKVTLISAPAGFGKTTLVCEWIASRKERGAHSQPPGFPWILETVTPCASGAMSSPLPGNLTHI